MMPCTILPRVTVEAGPGLPFLEAPASLSRKPRPPSRKPRPPFAEAPASPHTVSTGQLPQWSSGTLPLDPADWSREEHFTRLGRWASSPSGLGGKLERAWAVRGLARNRRWPCFLQWRGQRGQRASGGSGREGRWKADAFGAGPGPPCAGPRLHRPFPGPSSDPTSQCNSRHVRSLDVCFHYWRPDESQKLWALEAGKKAEEAG